jgi:hypothetical protein
MTARLADNQGKVNAQVVRSLMDLKISDADGKFFENGGATKPTLQDADVTNYQTVFDVKRREMWMKVPSPTAFADWTTGATLKLPRRRGCEARGGARQRSECRCLRSSSLRRTALREDRPWPRNQRIAQSGPRRTGFAAPQSAPVAGRLSDRAVAQKGGGTVKGHCEQIGTSVVPPLSKAQRGRNVCGYAISGMSDAARPGLIS